METEIIVYDLKDYLNNPTEIKKKVLAKKIKTYVNSVKPGGILMNPMYCLEKIIKKKHFLNEFLEHICMDTNEFDN